MNNLIIIKNVVRSNYQNNGKEPKFLPPLNVKNQFKDFRSPQLKKKNKFFSLNLDKKLCTIHEKNVHPYLKLLIRKNECDSKSVDFKDKLKILGNNDLVFKKDNYTIFRNNRMIKIVNDDDLKQQNQNRK